MSAYFIDQTEVTQLAYKQCIIAGMCDIPTCDYGQHFDRSVWSGQRLGTCPPRRLFRW
ncbi:hypothetical protein KBA39_05675 [Myxococcota bacterium]|nr:hypothetical protein [Myxococcota bacterium]